MNVGIDRARGHDGVLTGVGLGVDADRDVDIVLDVRVACATDADDQAVADTDVGLKDAGVVDDDRARDDGVHDTLVAGHAGVHAHALADHLAATEANLVALSGEVLFDAQNQVGISKTNAVTRGRAVQLPVLLTRNLVSHECSP